ncbi:MAG: Uma2 family endonuclease [Accumulibacter sp.]|jgi:Uma2 family endonuclease|uniref:Uma2 family endonuclease n=1 Tax=Accumulibacter sp. TaxID=2053492 RepID=UPI002FC2F603
MALALRDDQRHTYGEYLAWPEEARYELIDGIAYAMGPAPLRQHQRVVLEIARQIAAAVDGGPCEVNVAPFDVRLPRGNEGDDLIDTVVQPDIVVVCDRSKLDDRGCRGAPDWLVEVLSPSSAGHDQVRKLFLYERHGVLEYWLVHPADQVVTVYRLENGSYGRPLVQELLGTLSSSACHHVEIDWDIIVRGLR